jgi:hypothetical protein
MIVRINHGSADIPVSARRARWGPHCEESARQPPRAFHVAPAIAGFATAVLCEAARVKMALRPKDIAAAPR